MIDQELNIYDSICTGCSACTEACEIVDANGNKPIKLIKNQAGLTVPRIDKHLCKACMKCYQACPVKNKFLDQRPTFADYKTKIGQGYYGYSLNSMHRYEAATAGVATEVASYLLETKKVDAVISTFQNDKNEILTQLFTDKTQVLKTRGSIYRQVSLLSELVENLKKGKYKTLVIIGLPCHIEALKSLKKVNRYLQRINFFTIALFCKQTKTEEFSKFEKRLLGAKTEQKIIYRGKGWPGKTCTEEHKCLPFTNVRFSLNWSSFSFTPDYCFACTDPLGLTADLAIGDAWLKKYYKDKVGSSLVLANSDAGIDILAEMVDAKRIYLKKESTENIISSQNKNYLAFKTSFLHYRIKAFTDLKFTNNCYAPKSYKRLIRWIKFNKWLYETMATRKIADFMPVIFLKIYSKLTTKIFALLSFAIKNKRKSFK